MSKAKLLQPDLILGDTILGLSQEVLDHYRIKGLILDVDETLVPLKKAHVSEDLRQWVDQIRQKTPIWLVSNNLSESRIGRIANSLELPYLLGAVKPSRRKLKKAIRAMELPIPQVAMVGDRLFTDVLAGNRMGMFTILVKPMVDPAIAARSYPIHNFEVWISEKLGISLLSSQQKFTKRHKR
ncbi:putative HAD-superfamily phosphatase subfamily IIIA protein [Crocosphaera subtropica ATCC 51142]|uniref:HAD-superfamily phosphatase subfamily IIIA protein n=1 Tax=Crocosphaera subtropica (strain ATCC 51142 / BH68) TaxID=43989 RepID=B1X0B8_CROS5|nr:YqeG family HAD IIIA-type phosphatase [Crocosphaera subtropica]ACB49619.1 putative HAD-superfamily phosphatase subfamily IIIA protein [Crocosphaera subtropica ATCC 51142]